MSRRASLALGALLLLSTAGAAHAQSVTLSGYVQDARTGERLAGAALFVPARQAGTTTNGYGFFSLALPAGPVTVQVSYVGYRTDTLRLVLRGDVQRTIELVPTAVPLDELEITADQAVQEAGVSRLALPVAQVRKLPGLMGEMDLMKTLQLLPGVKSGMEGTGGLYVRGGAPDQNLILLDGTPVYNAHHLFGFLSVFNADAVREIALTKGGFPARYGGRLSSVLEVTMREGNLKEHVVQGAVGLLSSRLTVEGPIRRDRTAFLVSARRTYLDLLVRPFAPYEYGKPVFYFYDFNAKVNHIVSPRDRLYLSAYTGGDRFGSDLRSDDLESSGRLGWGNRTLALRWNRLWSPVLFMNLTLTYSDYALDVWLRDRRRSDPEDEAMRLHSGARYHSGIRDGGLRLDFDYVPGTAHYVRFGARGVRHAFRPGALQVQDTDADALVDTTFAPTRVGAWEGAAYVEDELRLGGRLRMNAGVHASALRVQGQTFGSVQPRLSARWLPGRDWALQASFATMQQYIHLLSHTSGLGLPTDLWVPATPRVPPQRAWQAALGASRTWGGRYETSVEAYYKQMDGLITYREGAAYLSPGTDWQALVTTGRGAAYGAELFVQRTVGRTTGWVGYTLAWSTRRFPEVSEGRAFPDRYDRRHDLAVVVHHRRSDRLDLSAAWVYATGNAVTMPLARYHTYGGGAFEGLVWTSYYGPHRNSFRMPAYHRLDLSATLYLVRAAAREHALSVSVYNAYNRKNPFYLALETDRFTGAATDASRLKGYALFPVLPSVSYRFRF